VVDDGTLAAGEKIAPSGRGRPRPGDVPAVARLLTLVITMSAWLRDLNGRGVLLAIDDFGMAARTPP
jgi:hypothetical protein